MVHSDSLWFIMIHYFMIDDWSTLKLFEALAKHPLRNPTCAFPEDLHCRGDDAPEAGKILSPQQTIGSRAEHIPKSSQVAVSYRTSDFAKSSTNIKTSSISILVYRSGSNLENTQMEKRWQQCLRHWAIDHEALVHFYARFQVPRAWPLLLSWSYPTEPYQQCPPLCFHGTPSQGRAVDIQESLLGRIDTAAPLLWKWLLLSTMSWPWPPSLWSCSGGTNYFLCWCWHCWYCDNFCSHSCSSWFLALMILMSLFPILINSPFKPSIYRGLLRRSQECLPASRYTQKWKKSCWQTTIRPWVP